MWLIIQLSEDHNHHPNPNQNRRRRRRLQHLCLDKAYNSAQEEQELIKRGYVLAHTEQEERRGEEDR